MANASWASGGFPENLAQSTHSEMLMSKPDLLVNPCSNSIRFGEPSMSHSVWLIFQIPQVADWALGSMRETCSTRIMQHGLSLVRATSTCRFASHARSTHSLIGLCDHRNGRSELIKFGLLCMPAITMLKNLQPMRTALRTITDHPKMFCTLPAHCAALAALTCQIVCAITATKITIQLLESP